MKKYYAKEMDMEYFDWEIYFDEFTAEYSLIWLGGNRDLIDINKSLYADVRRALDECSYDIDCEIEESELKLDFTGENCKNIAKHNIDYYFKPIRDNVGETNFKTLKNVPFTEEEYLNLLEYCMDCNTDSTELVAKTLSVIHGIKFDCCTLRGSCQRDWIECIYPVETSQKYLDYIEAVLFATGTELLVSEEMLESSEEFDDCGGISYYTAEYTPEGIKEYLANELTCTPEEIVLIKIKSKKLVSKYTYEEI